VFSMTCISCGLPGRSGFLADAAAALAASQDERPARQKDVLPFEMEAEMAYSWFVRFDAMTPPGGPLPQLRISRDHIFDTAAELLQLLFILLIISFYEDGISSSLFHAQ